MNLMAISLVLIIMISSVTSLSMNFSPDDKIYSNSEFEVFIDSKNNNQQDVRFFLNNSNSTLYVYEDNWRNAFRYILSSFPETKKYSLKISNSGEESLCIRLRETNNPKKTESICTNINVLEEKEENKEIGEVNSSENSIILLYPKEENKNSKVIFSRDYFTKIILIFFLNTLALICVFFAVRKSRT